MDIFKKFIEDNPHKILGEKITTTKSGKPLTDAWGKPTIEIRGGIEKLELIDVDDQKTPESNEKVFIPKVTEDEANEKLKKSLEVRKATKKAAPKKRKSKKRRRRIENEIFFDAQENVDMYSFKEGFENLSSHIDLDQAAVWVWYKKSQGLTLSPKWETVVTLPKSKQEQDDFIKNNLERKYLCYDPSSQEYLPSVIYYSGNIYDRLKAVENDWEKNGGKNVPNSLDQKNLQIKKLNHTLKEKIPQLRLVDEDRKRLILSPQSQFIKNTNIIIEHEEKSIWEYYKEFLLNCGTDEKKYYKKNLKYVIDIYLGKSNFKQEEWSEDRETWHRNAGKECVYQMKRFVKTWDPKQIEEVERKWNSKFNGFVNPNYDNIPLAFAYNKKFKNRKLEPRPAQREGVAFLETKGNGIVAFDVGVGKTMTAILAMAQALDNGECVRPLVIVPKPTLKKWITEIYGVFDPETNEPIIHGIIPNYPLINLGNLGATYKKKFYDPEKGFSLEIPEKSICIITHDALTNIGFSPEAEGDQFKILKEILLKNVDDDNVTKSKREARKNELAALNKKIGLGQENTWVFMDQVNWDYLCVDEAHNFSKVFDAVRGDNKEKTSYEIQQKSSAKGVKLWFLSAFIQRQNNYRNITLLTATPFNNSPLEVYGMLALTDYYSLKKAGVSNMQTFFDNFIDQTYEDTVLATGKVETRAVIKGWTNKKALQKLVFRYMNYKSGTGNVERPDKYSLPLLSEELDDGSFVSLPKDQQIPTYLEMTDRQKRNKAEIQDWLDEALADPKIKGGEHLTAGTMGMTNTLSPDVYEGAKSEKEEKDNEALKAIDPIDLIEESPKLKYTMMCIETIQEHHKKAGTELSNVIIYSNRGVAVFGKIQEYMLNEMGYKRNIETPYGDFDQVVVIAGSGKDAISDTKKEAAKSAFNDGYIKVIIGSQTIREGIDLQERTSTVFNLWCEWNPTSMKQLEGRAYRYGNMYNAVRIVTPIMVGSTDAWVWQKLEEKTGRINDIFDQENDDNILEVGVEEASAIKWAATDNLESLAESQIKGEKAKINQQIEILAEKRQEAYSAARWTRDIVYDGNQIKKWVDENRKYVSAVEIELENENDDNEIIQKLFRRKNPVRDYIIEHEGNTRKADMWVYRAREISETNKDFKALTKKLRKMEEYITKAFGEEYVDKYEELREKLDKEIEEIRNTELKKVTSPEYFEEVVEAQRLLKKKYDLDVTSIEETVAKFASLNHLLDNFDTEREDPKFTDSEVIEEDKEPEKVKLSKKALDLIPKDQRKLVVYNEEYNDIRKTLNERSEKIPAIGATDGKPDVDKIVWFRYFGASGFEKWITERSGDEIYGMHMIQGDTQNAELTYGNLEELRDQNSINPFKRYELDLNWKPIPLSEIKKQLGKSVYEGTVKKKKVVKKKIEEDKAEIEQLKKLQQAFKGVEVAIEFEEDPKKIEELKAALKGVEIAIEMIDILPF
jgi:hypothetical protein